MKIESGIGNGKWAGVDENNRLKVVAKSSSNQHVIATETQKTFQVIGTATLANGTVTPLTIKNTTTSQNIVITYIRWQILDPAGGTALPNASNYFKMGYDAAYSSGGTVVSEVNMTAGSNNIAGILAYNDNPTLSGTLTQFDRHYPKAAGDMNSFNKEGAAIVQPGQSITLQFVGDHTSGTIYTRCSFYVIDQEV